MRESLQLKDLGQGLLSPGQLVQIASRDAVLQCPLKPMLAEWTSEFFSLSVESLPGYFLVGFPHKASAGDLVQLGPQALHLLLCSGSMCFLGCLHPTCISVLNIRADAPVACDRGGATAIV